jgi:hypothetical protein
MMIFLACLFVVAVAIGAYAAFSIAEAILGAERKPHAVASPRPQH